VQGEGAKESIVRGIERLDALGLDVLIVGRGGGSIEDLWAFNEECVARAIFNARTPVISAVGHETDYTIADFAADVRAATPSQAAALANFEYAAFEDELEAYENAIQRQLEQRLVIAGHRLAALRERLQRLAPMQVLDRRREELDRLELRFRELLEQRCERLKEETGKKKTELDRQMEHRLTECRHRLRLQAARLDGFSPLKRISGGYGYLVGEDGKQIDSVRRVQPGQEMTVYLHDGRIQSRIESAELLEQDNICRETEKK
jgi:exodeoxyribonuclease VII large subunit